MSSLVECVPNFSEGRDPARVALLEAAIDSVPGSRVLDTTSDHDHHRSVITFAGDPVSVVESAVRVTARAAELIDLNQHAGVHPRLGVLDVLPFVPLGETTLEECVALAHQTGRRIWQELQIPVYFYHAAALRPDRQALEKVRHGGFEGLRESVHTDESKRPDLGGPALHPTAGAVIVGARPILIAFNINLETADVRIAKQIARTIRTSNGGLPGVKALGLSLESRGLTQVSMNLTDYKLTPPHIVFEAVNRLATAAGVALAGSELIGLLPRQVTEMAFEHFMRLPGFFQSGAVIENRVEERFSRGHSA